MDTRKRIHLAVLFWILAYTTAGAILLDNKRGYNSEADDNFYADYNAIIDVKDDRKMFPVWLAYMDRMSKSQAARPEHTKPNAYPEESPVDREESSADELFYQDPIADMQVASEFGEFKSHANQPFFRVSNLREKMNLTPWKRFGGGGGVFERFRTTINGARNGKQESFKNQSQNEPGDQISYDSTGKESNNVESDLFWKERLLPQGIFHSMARN